MNKAICFVLATLVLVVAIGRAQSVERPIDRMAASTYEKLQARDFAGLDQLADSLRTKNDALSDGQPALSGFYNGVSLCVKSGCDDERQSEITWNAHGKLLDAWISASPKSITARLAKAAYMKEFAWHARGHGYSNSVTPYQWDVFFKRIQQARSMLEEMRVEAENDPQWYASMLSIALAQGWPRNDFEKIYRAGIAKFPNYLPMYFTKAAYLSPKWGGTQAQFNKYVDEAVQSTREVLGEAMYARLHWSGWDYQMFVSGQTDWKRMKAGFMRMTKDYPDPWNTNNFAKFSCIAGDIETLTDVMSKIGDAIIVGAWGELQIFARCRSMTDTPVTRSVNTANSAPARVAPEQVSPRPGTIFDRFPRSTLIEWSPIAGANSYSVEIDCYNCCVAGKWCAELGKSQISASNIKTTDYRFDWVGSNLGRWRVWAVEADGRQGPKSSWWEFLYTK